MEETDFGHPDLTNFGQSNLANPFVANPILAIQFLANLFLVSWWAKGWGGKPRKSGGPEGWAVTAFGQT